MSQDDDGWSAVGLDIEAQKGKEDSRCFGRGGPMSPAREGLRCIDKAREGTLLAVYVTARPIRAAAFKHGAVKLLDRSTT